MARFSADRISGDLTHPSTEGISGHGRPFERDLGQMAMSISPGALKYRPHASGVRREHCRGVNLTLGKAIQQSRRLGDR
jgi:hypothetical protein